MPKSDEPVTLRPLPPGPPSPTQPAGYFVWSRDIAISVFAVLPLWLIYEALRISLAPDERNGVEALVIDTLGSYGSRSMLVLRVVLAVAIAVAAFSIHRRGLPWARIALVSAIEGAAYGLVLGPLTGAITSLLLDHVAVWLAIANIAPDLVASLGAGIFEEALFRLCLLSLLALLFGRVTHALGISSHVALLTAIALSAAAFSYFHHWPGGEPFETSVFVFRAVAGVVLGALFVLRGFAVCVYAHAVYDVHFYLSSP